MLKSPLVASFVLAAASPLVMAGDKPMADKVAATATAAATTTTAPAAAHHAQSTSDRQAAKSMAAGTGSTAALGARQVPAVRDWSAIDTQRDHLITPEEMEDFLQRT